MSFYNSRETLVPEMLSAMTQTLELEELETSEGTTVLVGAASERDPSRVAVISGGGSGHEPAHAGFIGEGMLDAAIPGEIFSSPSVTAVLEGIRHVAGTAGCLLVIKNYTGDRLNFGLAAERARQEGYKVETVLVADDVALPGFAQPRGLAGTILVHKVAGAAASAGEDLTEVADAARRAAASIRTIGLALGPVQLPGGAPDLERGAELGMGIHNEPGAKTISVDSAADAVARVLESLEIDAGPQKLVVMLNDLGGCSAQEGLVLTHELIRQIGPSRIARFIGPVRVMTSLGMQGFSVTVMPADDALVAALERPTTAPAWTAPKKVKESPRRTKSRQQEQRDTPMGVSSGNQIEERVRQGCLTLIELKAVLDDLDRSTGDGDAGTTFRAGAEAILADLDAGTLGFADQAAGMNRVATILETRMGGSSGVLLAILTTAMSEVLARDANWADALGAGLNAMIHHGGAEEGHSTMIDAIAPAFRVLDAGGGLVEAAREAESGARGTAEFAAQAGRAAYVPDAASLGVEDPGAKAVAALLTALSRN
ncbi:dihydroxyacetone kinase subunit DhaK [Nesterenkonia halotolerans]|uniref:Dihydroxyacetone kinase n=1 Tax=Nesterenkonia halotolerans TaxID=225325 RepID=A0ABR9J927_9MICC|nr:dihydroxyacetone kinase subunit DhaK [Nesterenkonia halotolerans]MBE1515354.1 dihydroxyacetone kinase [Nesterenkonia halotolerans]